jgi:MFS family permease
MIASLLTKTLGPAMGFRQYRIFWFGTLASVTGFQMLNFSQFWIIHKLTQDPLFLGYVGLASAVPSILLNLFGGVVADKLDRKRLIALTQSINAILILILALITFTEVVRPTHVIILAFLAGGVNAFDQPARQALYPALIDRSVMMNAVALNSAIWTGTRIIAPAIAGVVITFAGEGTSFLLSALGFFAMSVITLTIHVPKAKNNKIEERSKGTGKALFEGVKYILANNVFLLLIGITFFNSFFGMAYLPMMPVFAVEILKVGADGQGIIMGLGGIGALSMTIVLGRMGNFEKRGLLIILGSVSFGLTLAVFALSAAWISNYYLAMVLMLIVGASSSIYMISIMSSLQLMVPDNMRGRVMGFYGITWSIMPLGGMFAGGLAKLIGDGNDGVPFAVAIGGLLVALFAIGPGLLNSNVRNVGKLVAAVDAQHVRQPS